MANTELQTEKQSLIDYVRFSLGDGMVDVELDPQHYDIAFKKATSVYRQRSSNGVEESYGFLELVKETQEYTLPSIVTEVRQVFRRTIGSSDGDGANSRLFSSRVLSAKDVASTKWLKLQTISYSDQTGRERLWDSVTRCHADHGASIATAGVDAVAILALLKSATTQEVSTLLVRQFRPPCNTVNVELPAGLIDEGETAEVAALRELEEETGVQNGSCGLFANRQLLAGIFCTCDVSHS